MLSSSWRLHAASRAKLSEVLTGLGLSYTRSTTCEDIDGARATQCLRFVAECSPLSPSWVILDDEDVTKGRGGAAMAEARRRLVRTDGEVGLTKEDASRAIAILLGGT